MMKIKNRKTGKIYDCFTQAVDLNFNGKYVLRYVIGIENFQGFHNVCCEYDNDRFNDEYEVLEKF